MTIQEELSALYISVVKELETNISMRLAVLEDKFVVSGRGELHLSVLIETMRREGYEFQVEKPEVITKTVDGVVMEPVEDLIVDANIQKPKASASAVLKGIEIFIPLEGLIDLEIERQKIQKEITRLEGSLAGIDKKLSNEKFVSNDAPEVVEKERVKQKDWLENIGKLKEILNNLN